MVGCGGLWLRSYVLVFAVASRLCASVGDEGREATLLLALMVRDEEANLLANLPAFEFVADAVVCAIGGCAPLNFYRMEKCRVV